MAKRIAEDEDDWEDPDPPDDDEDDGEPTVPCPYCREDMLEDSPRCPHCGRYVSAEDAPPEKPKGWVAATAIALLIIMLLAVMG